MTFSRGALKSSCRESPSLWRIAKTFFGRGSDFMKVGARGLAAVVGGVDLEVGKERRGIETEEADRRHGEAADFQIGALAGAEGEHGAPGAGVGGDDDFRLR